MSALPLTPINHFLIPIRSPSQIPSPSSPSSLHSYVEIIKESTIELWYQVFLSSHTSVESRFRFLGLILSEILNNGPAEGVCSQLIGRVLLFFLIPCFVCLFLSFLFN